MKVQKIAVSYAKSLKFDAGSAAGSSTKAQKQQHSITTFGLYLEINIELSFLRSDQSYHILNMTYSDDALKSIH